MCTIQFSNKDCICYVIYKPHVDGEQVFILQKSFEKIFVFEKRVLCRILISQMNVW